MPLVVTADPPLEEIFPPEVAVDAVIEVTPVVVRTGVPTAVKDISLPYAVPAAFVA